MSVHELHPLREISEHPDLDEARVVADNRGDCFVVDMDALGYWVVPGELTVHDLAGRYHAARFAT